MDLYKVKSQWNKFIHGKQIIGSKTIKNVCPFPPEVDPSKNHLYKSNPNNSSHRRSQLFLVVSFFVVMLLIYPVVYNGSNIMFLTLISSFFVMLALQYVYHFFNRVPEAFD